jgi:[NiFe] hydrogenase diaphorase moiety large subunit
MNTSTFRTSGKHSAGARERNLLGKDIGGIKGFNFDIRIQFGAGAYVCGEESALIESAEGKRGNPVTASFPG